MGTYALLVGNVAISILDASPEVATEIGLILANPPVAKGWIWNGSAWLAPDPVPVLPRYILELSEWVDSWTEAEWENLQGAAFERGYALDWPGHPLDGVTAPQNVQRRLRQLFDAIKLTNSFDVQSEKAYQFYDYLTSKNFTTAARQVELQAGVIE